MIPRASAAGLSPVRAVLDNGAVILAQNNSTTPTVAINLTFFTGSVYDPPSLSGLAFVAALAIDRGTGNYSANQLADRFDDLGVSLRAWTTSHTFTVSCACLAVDLDEVLALLADIVRAPLFPEAEIDKRRVEAITSVKQDDDNPAARATAGALELLYGPEHPYGRPLKGTVPSLQRTTRADVARFHRQAIVPAALSVVLAGDVEPNASIDAAARLFGDWRGQSPPLFHVPAPSATPRKIQRVPMPGKAQSDIVYGFNTIRRVDPRYYAYLVMNHVLGQFGLGGRLADNIREKQGMAYYAYSTLESSVGEGPLLIRAGVDPVNVERALDAIDREVRSLAADGPAAREFEDSQNALIGSIPRLLETNDGIAEFLQTVEQFDLGLDHDRRLPFLFAAVTRADVAAAAHEALDVNRAAVVVAGPEAEGAEASVA